jgi:DNA polymerase-3 subunit alpha
MEVEVFDTSSIGVSKPVRIKLPLEQVSEAAIDELKTLLSSHPGDSEVFLHLGDRHVLSLPAEFSVDPAGGLVAEIRVLLGAESVLTG